MESLARKGVNAVHDSMDQMNNLLPKESSSHNSIMHNNNEITSPPSFEDLNLLDRQMRSLLFLLRNEPGRLHFSVNDASIANIK